MAKKLEQKVRVTYRETNRNKTWFVTATGIKTGSRSKVVSERDQVHALIAMVDKGSARAVRKALHRNGLRTLSIPEKSNGGPRQSI